MPRTSQCTRQPNDRIRESARFLLLCCAIILAPARGLALGFRIPNQDAAAVARANAFVATADDPSAIYYNPAGITQLSGQNAHVGVLNYLGINTHFDSPAGPDADTQFEVIPVPQIHYTITPTSFPLAFGLGVYAPYGLGVEWPDDSGFRSLAIESRLRYITVNPVVAWRIHPTLSIAAGPAVNFSSIMFRRGLATPSDLLKFEGDDISVGFNAGLLWQPCPQWSFGATYRSAATMNYSGTTTYNSGGGPVSTPTHARVPFPQIVTGGVSYRPTPKWNIEVDVDWTDWTTLDTVTLRGTRNIFGSDLPLHLAWHSSWFYEFGITRYLEQGWFVSAGYFYSGDTASGRYYTPAIPDTVLHVGSLGVGHTGRRWDWAVAAQLIAGPARNVSNSQPNPFTGESGNGKYQLFVPAVSLALRYHF